MYYYSGQCNGRQVNKLYGQDMDRHETVKLTILVCVHPDGWEV